MINDIWEKFTIKFQIFDPMVDNRSSMSLLMGSDKLNLKEHRMTLSPMKKEWLHVKYGKNIAPWEVCLLFDNTHGNEHGEYHDHQCPEMYYTYQKVDGQGKVTKEREPFRVFRIDNPTNYDGKQGLTGQREFKQIDDVQSVNGIVRKSDGTFLHGFFQHELRESNSNNYGPNINATHNSYNIIIGSHPIYEVDIEKIKRDGKASAVLNIMTDNEMNQRGLNEQTLQQFYRKHNINSYKRIPVHDDEYEEYALDLAEAC